MMKFIMPQAQVYFRDLNKFLFFFIKLINKNILILTKISFNNYIKNST